MTDLEELARLQELKNKYEACFDETNNRYKIPEELKIEIINFSEASSKTRKEIAEFIGIKFANDISVWKKKLLGSKQKNIQVVDKLGVKKAKPKMPLGENCFVNSAKNMDLDELLKSYKELKQYIGEVAEKEKNKLDQLNDMMKS